MRAAPAERGVLDPEIRERLARALGSQFEVRRLLCRGDRADIYEVWDASLGRRLAVKVLRPDVEWTEPMIAAFKNGTAVIARLNHPNVLPIHFVSEAEGLVYYARPFVDGQSLDTLVRTRGPLPLDEALTIAYPVLAALEHAHQQGVVHAGIKPANVMIDGATERPLLADFGIARLADCAPARAAGGAAAGSEYESPEQQAGREGDARSDVYGMSVVLFQATTARLAASRNPFEPPVPDGLAAGAAPALDKLPAWLVAVLMRGLSRDPRERYPSAAALADALRKGRASGDASPAGVDGVLARIRGSERVVLMPGAPAFVPPAPSPAPAPAPKPPVAEPPSAPLGMRRRRAVPILPWVALVVLLAAAAAAWLFFTRPALTVTNRLVLSVQLHVENAGDWTLSPGERRRLSVPRGTPVTVRWEAVRPMVGPAPVGERLAGAATVPRPDRGSTYDIVAVRGDTAYFAPLITNASGVPLQMVVNAGLAAARDCGCTVPPGAHRMPIGYYYLYANSTVAARTGDGRTAEFGGLGPSVTSGGGAVGLRFNAADLQPVPPRR